MSALVMVVFVAAGCSSEGPTLAVDEPQGEPQATAIASEPTAPAGSGSEQPEPSPEAPTSPAEETSAEAEAEPDSETSPEPSNTTAQDQEQPTAEPQAGGEGTASAGPTCTAGLTGQPATTSQAPADVDGDGAADLVTTYSLTDGSGEVIGWRIRYDTAAGESLDSPIPSWSPGDAVQPIGSADVDGDGTTQESFVVVGSGASASIVSLFVRQGCSIVAASTRDGQATFAIGGGIVNIAGLQCLDTDDNGTNNTIVAWTGEADPSASGTYSLEGPEYQLRGTELIRVGTRSLVANLNEADFAYGQLSCGTLGL